MSDIRDADAALQKAINERIAVGMADVFATLRSMTTFVPDIGFPGKPLAGDTKEDLDDCPFFTEMYLYNLVGKEDARTILAHLGELARALGYDGLWQMQEQDDESD